MTDATPMPLDSVTGLIAERERFLGWLAQLEARRDVTPAHVYQRVRADYEQRLDGVVARIAGHAADLQGVIDRLAERVRALREQELSNSDARAEAELRAAVGEYTDEEWELLRVDVDATLARIGEERQSAEAELARLEQLMALATPRSVARVPEPEVSQPAEEAVDVTALLQPQEVGPAAAPPAAEPPPQPQPVAASADEPQRRASGLDELEFLKSVIEPTGSYPAVQVADAAPQAPEPGQPLIWPADITDAARDLVPRSGSALANGMRDSSMEPIKTLRCQECGTMNYPTEWYCERCGGELAAL